MDKKQQPPHLFPVGKMSFLVTTFPGSFPSPIPDFLLRRMLHSGWVKEYVFVCRIGYSLQWTSYGWRKAQQLLSLIESLELQNSGAAKVFTDRCYQIRPSFGDTSEDDCRLWIGAIEELGLGSEETTLQTLCKMIMKLKPSELI